MSVAEDEPVWGDLQPNPIRVLVKGASSAVFVAPPGGGRTRQTYPWWLGPLLTSAGLPAEVRNAGEEAQPITKALCAWDTEVETWSPDVVILNYGIYESLPGFLPRRLERAATTWHRHNGPIRRRFRARIATPGWRRLAALQCKLEKALGRGPYRVKPKRFLAELSKLVDQITSVGGPLVLVMDPWPPASRWRSWYPGLDARATRLRGELRAWLATHIDPNVRLFPLSDILYRHDLDTAMPDGIHFSARVHREVAEDLATEILQWAKSQQHLQWQGVDAARYHRRQPLD